MSLRSLLRCSLFALVLALAAVWAPDLAALQASELGRQSLRPYWHVFAAYSVVIVALGGWAFSISQRLKNVEDRLVD
jgi:membrane protease YdiL (CAAX protease family)